MNEYDTTTLLRGGRYNESQYRIFTLALRKLLILNNYIDEEREDEWIVLFEGHSIRGDDQFTFRWNLANTHCVYLFDILEQERIIVKERLDITISKFFSIKNVAQTRYSYYPKPKGHEKIEAIVKDAIAHTSKF